tara:strand:+ start:1270 stop:1497 length:228 start_codon:yes stop_codon:yes gene_type:complete
MTITNAQYLSLIQEVSSCNLSMNELLAIIVETIDISLEYVEKLANVRHIMASKLLNVTQEQYIIILEACENSLVL